MDKSDTLVLTLVAFGLMICIVWEIDRISSDKLSVFPYP